MEKVITIVEETWGLGITRVETLRVTEREEKFFEELISRCGKVKVNEYPPVIKEYKLERKIT